MAATRKQMRHALVWRIRNPVFTFETAQCANSEIKPTNWRCFGLLMHNLMLLQTQAEKIPCNLCELRKL